MSGHSKDIVCLWRNRYTLWVRDKGLGKGSGKWRHINGVRVATDLQK
ncbi:orf80 [Lactobacillus phage LP65]|uniref:Orf80 n=1 Tax=Lactobacillus phage LP65 TaxID=2892344 RepID=Q5ULN4_9CAUD|nr:hypothetical protein LP65_gp080 [Lactobacillus phage LP65]AAV35900.1 orf80 [Lactobacillus phage LP65]